jgi:hypothetical protein
MMSERQLRERIFQLERELEVLKSIVTTPQDGKLGRPSGSTVYTDEQIKFLKRCWEKNLSYKRIVEEYNLRYGTKWKPSDRGLYNLMRRQGIIESKFSWKEIGGEKNDN